MLVSANESEIRVLQQLQDARELQSSPFFRAFLPACNAQEKKVATSFYKIARDIYGREYGKRNG